MADQIEISINEKTLKIFKTLGLIFIFIGLYFILSNLPIFSSPAVNPEAGLVLIVITGLLTSVHCVGMCGGFVVAYASRDSEEKRISRIARIKQHVLYNFGRIVSYITFGVLAGLVGSIFILTGQLRGYLSIFAGMFMVLYGLSVFFPWLRRLTTIRTPNIIRRTKDRGPLFFGLLNGLMPCGPLQAMLIYAAGTGSFVQGGLVMLVFGFGTLPLMFGFGSVISFLTHTFVQKIMKISAVVVIALGVIMLNRGLLLSGYELPNLFATNAATGLATAVGGSNGFQQINMTVDRYGWNPDTFVVKKGILVKWNIYVKELTSCNKGLVMPKYGINQQFQKEGESVTLEFTPLETGTFTFTCWMGMLRGSIIVEEGSDTGGRTEGYVKEPGKATFKIRGMCCSGCARHIENLVSGMNGVKNVKISFETGKGYVEFDSSKITVEDIISKIKSTGRYDAQEAGG